MSTSDNEEDRKPAARQPKATSTSGVLGEEELKGYLFSYGHPKQVEHYMRTMKAFDYYFGRKFTRAIHGLVMEGVEGDFTIPEEPPGRPTTARMERYRMELKLMLEREEKYKDDKSNVFHIIWAQCTPTMKNKLESVPKFSDLKRDKDVAGLMKTIKDLVFATDSVVYEPMVIQAQLRALVNLYQKGDEPLAKYHKAFMEQLEATQNKWGLLIPTKYNRPPPTEEEGGAENYEAPEIWHNRVLACLFLAGVNRKRHKSSIDALHNDFQLGKISYPQDIPSMMAYLSNRRGAGGGTSQTVEAMQDGVPTAVTLNQFSANGKGKGKKKSGSTDQNQDTAKEREDGSTVTSKSSKSGKFSKSRTKWEGSPERPPHWAF